MTAIAEPSAEVAPRPTVDIRLRSQISEAEMAEKIGKVLTRDDFNLVPTADCIVRKPDGKVLLVYRRGIIPPELRDATWPILHELKDEYTTNRGLASGTPRIEGPGKRSYAMGVPSALVGAFEAQGPKQYCISPDSLVLCADLSWTRAGNVEAGAELIGFDEENPGPRQQRKFRPSTVESAQTVEKPRVRVVTSIGETVCSDDHLWLVVGGDRSACKSGWVKASDLRVGDRIFTLGDPWQPDVSREAGYLAGMADGEGCVSNQLYIAQSDNEALAETKRCLDARGIAFGESLEEASSVRKLYINGGLHKRLQFLGSVRPPRLLARSRRAWDGADVSGRREGHAVVEAVENLPNGEVVAIATSTRTLIVDGLLSHNCRLTAWTGRETEKYRALWPLLEFIGDRMQADAPDRWAAQMKEVRRTNPDWLIPGTPFTTVTVNNCVDADTECLTRRLGWTRHEDLLVGDELLAYDAETDSTRWEPIQDKFVNDAYRGEMTLLTSRSWSALVTPDHRWPVRHVRGVDRIEVRRTFELPGHEWALLRAAPHEAPVIPTYSDEFVRLVAWYITEGHERSDGQSVTLAQSRRANPEKVDAIRSDLVAVGARTSPAGPNVHRVPGRKGNTRRDGLWISEHEQAGEVVTWVLSGSYVDSLLAAAPSKVPSMHFLSTLTTEQSEMFVQTCIEGDGTPERGYFYQQDDGRTDAFAVAAVLAGRSVLRARVQGHTPRGVSNEGYRTSIHRNNDRIYLESVKRTPVMYEGTIWCPSLPSGHWVARRDGRTFITGNTYPTGVHKDAGDLDAGISTLAVFRRGDYTGAHLVFPEYRIAVDMQDGDLILMDAHAFHGNIDFEPSVLRAPTGRVLEDPGFERISIVSYFRTKLVTCDSAADEATKHQILAEQRAAARVGE